MTKLYDRPSKVQCVISPFCESYFTNNRKILNMITARI
jgi:hypothetical protein